MKNPYARMMGVLIQECGRGARFRPAPKFRPHAHIAQRYPLSSNLVSQSVLPGSTVDLRLEFDHSCILKDLVIGGTGVPLLNVNQIYVGGSGLLPFTGGVSAKNFAPGVTHPSLHDQVCPAGVPVLVNVTNISTTEPVQITCRAYGIPV